MSFSVVVFPDEDAIEVVSTSWLSVDKKLCHWPQAKQNKFYQLVINHSNPSASGQIKWKSYPCRYLQSYESYEIAQKHCRRGEITSNIDSGPEDVFEAQFQKHNTRKRPAKRPIKRGKLKFSPGGSQSSATKSSDSSESDDDRLSESDEPQNIGTPFLGLVRAASTVNSQARESVTETTEETTNSLKEEVKTLREELAEERSKNERFQQSVLAKLVCIGNDLKELLKTRPESNACPSKKISFDLPVTTVGDLEKLKIWLNNEDNTNELVSKLCVIGGNSHKDITYRILHELMSDSVAKDISYTGKGSKTVAGLKGTAILTFLYEAVRQTNGGANATNQVINEDVKSWLKNAADRLGGREKRRKKSQEFSSNHGENSEELPSETATQ